MEKKKEEMPNLMGSLIIFQVNQNLGVEKLLFKQNTLKETMQVVQKATFNQF
jgi:hypothetical protein